MLPLLEQAGVDALIVSDPARGCGWPVKSSRRCRPASEAHRRNTTNRRVGCVSGATGASKRIILARELTLRKSPKIAASVGGYRAGRCLSQTERCVLLITGRCYLSAFRNRVSANTEVAPNPAEGNTCFTNRRGPGDPLIVEEDERFSYLLSSKDLCLVEASLPEVLATGVSAIKI